MAGRAVRVRTEDDDPMAACGLAPVLEMEVPVWSAEDSRGVAYIDPQDGSGKPGVGLGANRQ
jgi:hypothetical protein